VVYGQLTFMGSQLFLAFLWWKYSIHSKNHWGKSRPYFYYQFLVGICYNGRVPSRSIIDLLKLYGWSYGHRGFYLFGSTWPCWAFGACSTKPFVDIRCRLLGVNVRTWTWDPGLWWTTWNTLVLWPTLIHGTLAYGCNLLLKALMEMLF
jgi:hypothetical protein